MNNFVKLLETYGLKIEPVRNTRVEKGMRRVYNDYKEKSNSERLWLLMGTGLHIGVRDANKLFTKMKIEHTAESIKKICEYDLMLEMRYNQNDFRPNVFFNSTRGYDIILNEIWGNSSAYAAEKGEIELMNLFASKTEIMLKYEKEIREWVELYFDFIESQSNELKGFLEILLEEIKESVLTEKMDEEWLSEMIKDKKETVK